MKWNEMTTIKKIISVIGWICGFVFFILSLIDLFDLLQISEAIKLPLFSAFWVSMGINQSNEKLAKWYYIVAAGYALLALLYIFF